MMGRRVDELSITADGQVRTFHDGDINAWLPFDPRQTVFEDALAQGYSTGIAGWYNPYCRILPSVLDRCFWTSESPLHGHMYSERSVLSNVVAPLDSLASAARQGVDPERSSMHALDYQTLVVAGDELLKDSSCDFIFLHMPIPHPGGIFDRRRMKFTTAGASYVDNLALADAYLAHVRGLLERRGDWDLSTVVVMGDHSWRTKLMWEGSPEWTAEDEAASHGGEFDDRPAYIVKLAGQQTGATINAPFAATRTRALLDGILAGRLHSVEDLKAWVGQAQH
jgi:hypothetical protein